MGLRQLLCCGRRRVRVRNYVCAVILLAAIYIICQGTSIRLLQHKSEAKGNDKHQKKLTEKLKVKSAPKVTGVRTDDLLHYVPDEDGLFHCIDGSDKIPMSRLNDEYCDCPTDGSDEPGTDACPNGRFYCELEDKFLPSGKINDGICDCCDGSDEWKTSLGAHKVKDFPFSDIIQHAPCIDLCSNIADKEKEEARVRHIGQRLKEQYIASAKGHFTGEIYGKQGEFYHLSKECFDYADFSAVYKICPWKQVEQTQKAHVFRIGRKGAWDLDRADGKRVLIMGEGDSRGCPNGPRRTQMVFRCGLTNSVAKLREDSKCVYSVDFMTPAAC